MPQTISNSLADPDGDGDTTACSRCTVASRARAAPLPPPDAGFGADAIRFSVNGAPCTVTAAVDPRTVLVDYLRDTLGLSGTKIGCGEGGCGACTVTLIRPGSRGKETVSANSRWNTISVNAA